MNALDVLNQRLHTQRLAGEPFARPEDVVEWLCGVQSQDYPGAKWSVGQRVKHGTDALVDEAFNAGRMLRTHVLRPTWHFVMPEDIRWMLELTAPHVHRLCGTYYRKLELDDAEFARCHELMAEALRGGRHLTRAELGKVLTGAGIVAENFRLGFIVMHAELDGLICSGALRGKQQTYALLEERAPGAKRLGREEALAELTRRFFVGHGPATLKDYARWSGLTLTDCRRGLEMVKGALIEDQVEGKAHWFGLDARPAPAAIDLTAYFLPEYDECTLTYPEVNFPDMPAGEGIDVPVGVFYRPVIIGGKRAGTWRRTVGKRDAVMEVALFATLDAAETAALEAATARYEAFLGLPVSLSYLDRP